MLNSLYPSKRKIEIHLLSIRYISRNDEGYYCFLLTLGLCFFPSQFNSSSTTTAERRGDWMYNEPEYTLLSATKTSMSYIYS
ncbi:hypothetical protein glysoja_028509 [Glycine soja]|uniref:Uncharacterized protein n=1 Tax=Glycine soja TaxID=3848 RepID=A0A0B2P2E0_GLYSO|nr:hypothetical protein glysoja_028509 [Glycine soja]